MWCYVGDRRWVYFEYAPTGTCCRRRRTAGF
jgi:hypothetical protein